MLACAPAYALCLLMPAVDSQDELRQAISYFECVQIEQMQQLLAIREELNGLATDHSRSRINPDDIADLQFRIRQLQEAVDDLLARQAP